MAHNDSRCALLQLYQEELAFYQRYHTHPTNWAIHALCVPLEWFSWLVLLSYLGPGSHWPVAVSVGTYQCFAVWGHSVKLAAASALTQVVMAACADELRLAYAGARHAWVAALLIHAASWAGQVLVGHYWIEQNKPGMVNKLTFNSVVLSVPMAWDTSTSRARPSAEVPRAKLRT